MGDSGGGGPDPSIYAGSEGAVYPSGSAGAQARLADWQKVNPLGRISRANRDAFIKSQDSGQPNFSLLGMSPSADPAGLAGRIRTANAYEDQLTAQFNNLKTSENSLAAAEASKAKLASDAIRNNELLRAESIGGVQRGSAGILTGAQQPSVVLPQTILSAPLGVPGGAQPTGKSILGS